MLSTIMIVLAVWLGLNAAFVAIRFYITADQAALRSMILFVIREPSTSWIVGPLIC